jgi:choice-of-anchor B domain-containing protein
MSKSFISHSTDQFLSLFLVTCLLVIFSSSCSKNDDSPEPLDDTKIIADPCVLIGNLAFNEPVSDITGYLDPITAKEYALIGFGEHCHDDCEDDLNTGVYIVDVTNPTSPTLISTIHTVNGFDLKTYDHYLYVVNGEEEGINNDHRGSIYDIQDLNNPIKVGSFPSSHNAFIDEEKGLLVTSFEGLKIYDIKTNPEIPLRIWSDGDDRGHDATIVGDRLFDFHETETNIYNITDPKNPELITKIAPPESLIQFHHSGWPTTDGNYLIINDEGANKNIGTDITIWDISSPGVANFVSSFNDPDATVHNVHVVENKAYFSYYGAGIRVFDISNPELPLLLCQYATSEAPIITDPNTFYFGGAWGVYAYLPSGNILISDTENGLFIFSK